MVPPASARLDLLRALAALDANDRDAAVRHLRLAIDALTGPHAVHARRLGPYRGPLTREG